MVLELGLCKLHFGFSSCSLLGNADLGYYRETARVLEGERACFFLFVSCSSQHHPRNASSLQHEQVLPIARVSLMFVKLASETPAPGNLGHLLRGLGPSSQGQPLRFQVLIILTSSISFPQTEVVGKVAGGVG